MIPPDLGGGDGPGGVGVGDGCGPSPHHTELDVAASQAASLAAELQGTAHVGV